jgi:hypothetical protein
LPLFVLQLAAVKSKTDRENIILYTASIIAELEAQRDRINSAIAALQSRGNHTSRPSSGIRRKKRTMSAENKRKLSLAAKARWAKAKKAGKNAL